MLLFWAGFQSRKPRAFLTPAAAATPAATTTVDFVTASVALADVATGIRNKDHFSLSPAFQSPPSAEPAGKGVCKMQPQASGPGAGEEVKQAEC